MTLGGFDTYVVPEMSAQAISLREAGNAIRYDVGDMVECADGKIRKVVVVFFHHRFTCGIRGYRFDDGCFCSGHLIRGMADREKAK